MNWISAVLILGLAQVAASGAAPLKRVANTTLRLPLHPPERGYRLESAFPGLSFTNPLAISSPPGETNRLFIVEQPGRITVISNLAAPTRTVFLDIAPRVVFGGEQGLLGLAFSPGYATNRCFYVFYTLKTNTAAGSGLHDRLARFRVREEDRNLADADSELPLITQKDDAGNHNGGDLHFGPEGYLYVSLGDEGAANDSLGNSQRIEKDFFAGILRLDVDGRPGSLPPNPHPANTDAQGRSHYRIPPDNPLVGVTEFNRQPVDPARVHTEFWAVGLRNPWRMSFDRDTGLLYVGDVGQDLIEEVDLIVKGGNYGWNYYEANGPGPRRPPAGLDFLPPWIQYFHGQGANQGNSVTGGLVYRGHRLSQLYGAYLFADYVSGHLWSARFTGTNQPPFERLLTETGIAGFGVDPRQGDVLVAVHNKNTIKRLVYEAGLEGGELPPTLADTGAFADLRRLRVQPGWVPYEINTPFWSDGAEKRRWFTLPNPAARLGLSVEGNWDFPAGSVWLKHFDLWLTNGVPTSARRLETRFLVKNEGGVYGLTYRWDAAQRNATLVPEQGLDETWAVQRNGLSRTQVWHYPSRSECLACHTRQGGWALGFNTAQLNRSGTGHAGLEHQLGALRRAGYLSAPLPELDRLPALTAMTNAAEDLTQRVRSYLAANCAYCHQPGGTAVGLWDGRLSTPLAQAGLVDGPLNDIGEDPANRVIAPGSPERSQLLQRLRKRGPGQMPPLASNQLDESAIALVEEWIRRQGTSLSAEPVKPAGPRPTTK